MKNEEIRDPTSGTESANEEGSGLTPEEQPVVTGTLFLTLIFLMMIFGFWAMMYLTLLNR